MPPTSEQPTPMPPPVVTTPIPSKTIKFIRIFLLVLIVLGLILIATQSLWVLRLVNAIVPPPIVAMNTPSVQTTIAWASFENSITSSSSIAAGEFGTYGYHEVNGQVYLFNGDVTSNGVLLKKVNPQTLLVSYSDYAKDSKSVYCLGNILSGADPSTFVVLQAQHDSDLYGFYKNYAKDSAHVYSECEEIVGTNPATFVVPTQQ